MTSRATAPAGAPCWVDLSTTDVERARRFYCAVFDWGAEEPNPEFGGYFNFTRGGARTAGCMAAVSGVGTPDVWSVYLASDDVDKTLEVATAAGGQVVVPAMVVGDLGTMAVLVDPGGASVGVWQPRAFPGFGVTAEHGAPGWFELLTRDYAATLDFYRTVFGWETMTLADGDDLRYTVVREPGGDGRLAGVMDAAGFLPEGVPAHWSVYFWVDDADAAAARAGSEGGSVQRAPQDTPYGRLATVADPAGATFKLIAANEAMPATP